jgi:hypothetical protein
VLSNSRNHVSKGGEKDENFALERHPGDVTPRRFSIGVNGRAYSAGLALRRGLSTQVVDTAGFYFELSSLECSASRDLCAASSLQRAVYLHDACTDLLRMASLKLGSRALLMHDNATPVHQLTHIYILRSIRLPTG